MSKQHNHDQRKIQMPYKINSQGKILPSYTNIGMSLNSASAYPHINKQTTHDIWSYWSEELIGNDFHHFT